MLCYYDVNFCVFFHVTASTSIYTDLPTLSLHDALPIWLLQEWQEPVVPRVDVRVTPPQPGVRNEATKGALTEEKTAKASDHVQIVVPLDGTLITIRSEEHKSELQ